ncbi:alpha/beta hydrolase [Agarivorans sp. Z349TD_8]|uniref:alpha/beta hydrolase n=1 Tax=Agarivorans sp. Z349TD_8 TaxID=3421434 RepID=UPI003D7E909F
MPLSRKKTSRKLVKQLPSLCCLLSLKLAAAPLPIEQTISLDAHQSHSWSIALQSGDYLSGKFSATNKLEQATLDDPNGKRIKQLLLSPSQGQSLHLVAQQSGNYQLTLTNAAVPNQLTLKLRKPALAMKTAQTTLASQTLQELIDQYVKAGNTELFWQQISHIGSPLIEAIAPHRIDEPKGSSLVTFLWRGAKHNVKLLGGPGHEHHTFKQIEDSDIWYLSLSLPNNSLFSYQIAPDVPTLAESGRAQRVAILSTAQRDPFNPNTWHFSERQDKYTSKSILRLAAAPAEPWLTPVATHQGTLSQSQISSKILNNSRDVYLYRSANPAADSSLPLVIFFDAESYLQQAQTPQLLDNLVNAKKIPALNAVFISNPSAQSRATELACNPQFSSFLAKELLPWLAQQNITAPAKQTILAGSSYGGLTAACTATLYPELFGGVLSLSGSFWWGPKMDPSRQHQPEWLTQQLALKPTSTVRWYLSAGLFEETWILPPNRRLKSLLDAKGYQSQLSEIAGGHDMLAWRTQLPEGLIYLLDPQQPQR